MIRLTFAIGGNLRKVYIDKRKISMLTAETGWVPILMDLDKIDKKVEKKLGKDAVELLKEISKLKTEKAMAKDIIRDFQESGWRLFKRE